MENEKRTLKKMFPNLTRELEGGESKVTIDSVRANVDEAEKSLAEIEPMPVDKFRHYIPTVVDFIRRCDTLEQAEEIVAYLQKRGEISSENAQRIRTQLKKEGVRSFGSKKEDGYYFKQSGICWTISFVGTLKQNLSK